MSFIALISGDEDMSDYAWGFNIDWVYATDLFSQVGTLYFSVFREFQSEFQKVRLFSSIKKD